MSTNINTNDLRNFIINNLHIRELSKEGANKYDIKDEKFNEADLDVNEYLDVDEIIEDKDLYEKFATLYVEEQKKEAEAKDKEKEKEEETKVKDKSQAKA